MLCLLSTCSIVQPYSLQPTIQVDVPLDEYILLVKSMCDSNVLLYEGIFNLSQYRTAVREYDRGNTRNANVLFTFDMFRAGVMELKKAAARGKSATVITLNYGDDTAENIPFDKMVTCLNAVFQAEGDNHRLFNKTVDEINRTYNTIPIDIVRLNEHNQNYYSYLALLRYNIASSAEGHDFHLFNVSI